MQSAKVQDHATYAKIVVMSFVFFANPAGGRGLCKQRLSPWIVEAISLPLNSKGLVQGCIRGGGVLCCVMGVLPYLCVFVPRWPHQWLPLSWTGRVLRFCLAAWSVIIGPIPSESSAYNHCSLKEKNKVQQ